jgi:hypothetical protein
MAAAVISKLAEKSEQTVGSKGLVKQAALVEIAALDILLDLEGTIVHC